MQGYTLFFVTVNALRVSGGYSAQHQELKAYTEQSTYLLFQLVHTIVKVPSSTAYRTLAQQAGMPP
jgi:hypothetical protein